MVRAAAAVMVAVGEGSKRRWQGPLARIQGRRCSARHTEDPPSSEGNGMRLRHTRRGPSSRLACCMSTESTPRRASRVHTCTLHRHLSKRTHHDRSNLALRSPPASPQDRQPQGSGERGQELEDHAAPETSCRKRARRKG